MIYVFIGLIVLFVIGIFIEVKWDFDTLGSIVRILSTMILISSLTFWPINYYNTIAEIEEYNALKETIEYSRNNDLSEYERTTILRDIADYNKHLASTKYWNKTIFDIYIADEFAELEPLR